MTQTMTASAARKASKKTQHVRSTGDWITLIVLIAAALLVLFPLLVLCGLAKSTGRTEKAV